MNPAPKTVLSIRPDTMGDLVIYSSALTALQWAWPEAKQVVLVRKGYEDVAPLFDPGIDWRTISFNPFKQKPSECREELEALFREIEAIGPDLILAPTLNRTWLELAVAARFAKVRSVALGTQAVDPLFAAALRIDLGVDAGAAFKELFPASPGTRDWNNQHRLVDHLVGQSGPRLPPRLRVPAPAVAQADRMLAELGVERGNWVAVFAGGLANVKVKAWPAESLGELAAWIEQDRKLPVVLLGHESEKDAVDAAARAAAARGAKPKRWLGKGGDLPVLAALLDAARLYAGIDTGAMHIAAALDRPTVGIFGGGHGMRFRPVGKRTITVVHPLPCFGCGWDCEFGDGPCVKRIGVADVQRAVAQALDAGEDAFDEVLEVRNLSEDALGLIAGVAPRYRALQADRIDRQHKIEDLKAETNLKDVEIDELKRAAEERKAESDEKDLEIIDLKRIAEERKAESDAKDVEIDDLKKETDAKDEEIADLKRAAEERKAESETKDREIAELKDVCNERERLIIEQDGHIKTFQKIVADLNAAVADRDRRLLDVQAERDRLAALLAKLPDDAATWADRFEAKDVHIRNIEAVLGIREREAKEKDASLANHAAGYHNLEQAKRYGRLLAEKEAMIQTLHRACVERQEVIDQLAAGSTKATSFLRRLWLAARAEARLKCLRPLSTWFFRQAVERYWMQIGILRQYEPRPIRWDKRLPKKGRVPEAGLPRIAIVTPSYGQPAYIESTMLSILNQNYPKLLYVVQDGGSGEAVREVIARHASRLTAWESAPDKGQADAVRKGFAKIEAQLGPDDVMAWLNSDDFLAPRALRFVADYFARNPKVDVVYGHRIIIDESDREVARWIMPRHDRECLEWIDYVPQETLFWRKRAWDLAGGIDPSFHFALDWDILARFQQSGCSIVRLPYFLGCFRVHPEQKTSHSIHTTGAEEMARIRARFHPGREQEFETINDRARKVRLRGALTARLLGLGVRW